MVCFLIGSLEKFFSAGISRNVMGLMKAEIATEIVCVIKYAVCQKKKVEIAVKRCMVLEK